MGPGIVVKSLLKENFSLVVFGWSQIVIDLQPLYSLVTGKGELHGFSHTYIGATLLACICALTGKYLGELGLRGIRLTTHLPITWTVAIASAFIGTYSHVLLDSIMHYDVQPFAPFSTSSILYKIITVTTLHYFCIATALLGSVFYFYRYAKK